MMVPHSISYCQYHNGANISKRKLTNEVLPNSYYMHARSPRIITSVESVSRCKSFQSWTTLDESTSSIKTEGSCYDVFFWLGENNTVNPFHWSCHKKSFNMDCLMVSSFSNDQILQLRTRKSSDPVVFADKLSL